MEERAERFFERQPDGFLAGLWPEAFQLPTFETAPFSTLSFALHEQTQSLYEALVLRENWDTADQTCIQDVKLLSGQMPRPENHLPFFTCPPADHYLREIVESDAWTLVTSIMGVYGQKNPLVTSVPVDERLGRLIFGSMELGLARMTHGKTPTRGDDTSFHPPERQRAAEKLAWQELRREANLAVIEFQKALSEPDGLPLSASVARIQQNPEGLWELHRRAGKRRLAFQEELKRLYRATDKALIRRLSKQLSLPETHLRFTWHRDPFKPVEIEAGRYITYQRRAVAGDLIPEAQKAAGTPMRLRGVGEGELAWIDLSTEVYQSIYEDEFYRVFQADRLLPEHTPASFARSMGQIFGDRLPAEHERGLIHE